MEWMYIFAQSTKSHGIVSASWLSSAENGDLLLQSHIKSLSYRTIFIEILIHSIK